MSPLGDVTAKLFHLLKVKQIIGFLYFLGWTTKPRHMRDRMNFNYCYHGHQRGKQFNNRYDFSLR